MYIVPHAFLHIKKINAENKSGGVDKWQRTTDKIITGIIRKKIIKIGWK